MEPPAPWYKGSAPLLGVFPRLERRTSCRRSSPLPSALTEPDSPRLPQQLAGTTAGSLARPGPDRRLICFLLLELRYDHNHVVGRHWIAWVPIAYSGLMAAAGLLCLARWDRGGRTVLAWLFAAGILVGLVGFWQHNEGALLGSVARMLSAWGGARPDPMEKPPVLAPLAFAGLGLLGIAACRASRH